VKIQYRVKKESDFKKILDAKNSFKNGIFSLHYLNNRLSYARVGISTSKTLGNAVVRNKIRRQIRSMVDNLVDFAQPIDILVLVKVGYLKQTYMKNKNDLSLMLERIHTRHEKK
jgi:ribonuclease P protein component